MKAYVFPGQGAQYPGMGKDLYENSSAAILPKKEQIIMPEEEESEDDPWDKVNEKTIQRYK